MPTYTFLNNETGEEWTEMMSISEKEKFLSENNKISQVVSAPALHSGRGMGRPASGFCDVLKEIKNKHSAGGKIGGVKVNTW